MIRLRHPILGSLHAVSVLLLTTSCFVGPGQTDKGSDIVSLLKIRIPQSATDIVGHTDSGIDFFMPNDEWRDYIAGYYPDAVLTPRPSKERDGSAPIVCYPSLRSGAELTNWTTGDDIQYRDTDYSVYRFVSITPDCAPGKAYIRWSLDDPK